MIAVKLSLNFPMQGTVIVLNGPSSSGKTTLSHAVRDMLGVQAVAVPIDRLFSMRHPAHPVMLGDVLSAQ